MIIKLNSCLLNFLIKKGYKYCLAQTTGIDQADMCIIITLKPVKKHPLLQNLPKPFSAYYNILEEPVRMVKGFFNTQIMVELELKDAENFAKLTGSL